VTYTQQTNLPQFSSMRFVNPNMLFDMTEASPESTRQSRA